MNLSMTQARILRLIAAGPKTQRDISHRDSLDNMPIAGPVAIESALEALQDAELISRVGMHFTTTPKGAKESLRGEAQSRTFMGKGTYTGPEWLIREGGLQHLQFKSRGAGC